MFKVGEVWRASWAFDTFSKKRHPRNNDDDQDTIRIKRIWQDKHFTILDCQFVAGLPRPEAADAVMELDRYCVAILCDNGVWYTEIPVIDSSRYQKVV